MDLRQIEYFCLASKAGSFSAAAKSAFVTQQTLSASVAALEGELGMPLFHRRRQGIQLTDFGGAFLPKAVAVLEAARSAESFAAQWKESTHGAVAFAYATASLQDEGTGFTLATLRDFRATHAGADLRVFELTSDSCLAAVERGSVDMAFVVGRPDPSVFEFEQIAEGNLLVAVPASHPLAERQAISFADLAEVDLFPVPDLNISYHRIVEGFARYGLAPRYAPVPFSLDHAREFVRSGRGVDFSPAHNAEMPHEGIAYVPLTEEDSFTLPLGLASKLGVPEKPLVGELREAIRRAACEENGRAGKR
ncbi:LysR family transcriptional regulator [Adlercreutzia sp. R21]|uniref:LysR family transcriptional regulator n=1 Tax=Adlercreutzia wanghongyangiae TaxID=3111451 RepID=UPI002DB8AEC4|nr:LysR family transcriptional regulator [Adlercreutzia sp. R21]MEC4184583.1 LysR family transcriptional regulator [Adlercreutzia sp. R21]